jgi:hypothetical protein
MHVDREDQRLINGLQQRPHATAGNPPCLLECLHLLVKGNRVLGAAHWSASDDMNKLLVLVAALQTGDLNQHNPDLDVD